MNRLLMKLLAVLNLGEGVIHLVTAAISFWGMLSLGVWDWRLAASPTADFALGLVSLVTAAALHQWHARGGVATSRGPAVRGFAAAVPKT
jgi:hypothetical protein